MSDLRNLIAYLEEPHHGLKTKDEEWSADFIGFLMGLLAVVILFVLLAKFNCFFLFAFFGVAKGFSGIVNSIKERARKRKMETRWASGTLTEAHRQALEFFQERLANGSLEERTHPAVGAALDACAAHVMELRRILADPKHLPELREEALMGADEEMYDALLDAKVWIRAKGAQRKTFEAKIAASPDPPEAAKLRERAKRLGTLRDHIADSIELPRRGVDRVLGDLRERKVAEEELRERF